ncbi:MAG: type II secretion system protein [Parachlamydiales bacterium]
MKGKRYLTLIEIMIVIVLIGLIGGVVAYNVSGSLEEGKAFKTKQGASQLGSALMLQVATGEARVEELPTTWQERIEKSSLVNKKGKDLMTDGWGGAYSVTVREGELEITSERYTRWYAKKHPNYEESEIQLY